MANLLLPPDYRKISDNHVTPEDRYWNRRTFLKAAGIAGLGLAGSALGCAESNAKDAGKTPKSRTQPAPAKGLYPASRNENFADAGRPLTPREISASYNNFYEFTTDKERVKDMVSSFTIHPWEVEVTGLCEKPGIWDLDDLEGLGLEERVYRFRCVEAWAMTVPWTGVPLRKLIEKTQPKAKATHIRFISFYRPKEAPGQARDRHYPWPYYEALRMDEAMNELTLLVTGIYGARLPKQHGAPVRIIAPWKYGYKSPKSIVKIEFVQGQPGTFWNDLQPKEYSFLSNVDPEVPHPRWSQASERLITTGERIPTHKYNGYGEYVAGLYT